MAGEWHTVLFRACPEVRLKETKAVNDGLPDPEHGLAQKPLHWLVIFSWLFLPNVM